MRKMRSMAVAVAASIMFCVPVSAATAKDEAPKGNSPIKAKGEAVKAGAASKPKDDAARIGNAVKVLKAVSAIPKRRIPPLLLSDASAVVVVPGAMKHSFMVSGGNSGGILLERDKDGKWSNPVFITLSGGTIGWQIVSDPFDIILVFKSKKNVDTIVKGSYTMDAKSKIEPGWLGLNLKGAPTRVAKADIAAYVRSRGAFVEDVTMAGSSVKIDAEANGVFYAKPKVEAADILSGKVSKQSEDIKALQKLLADYAAAK